MQKKYIDKLAFIHVQDKKILVTLSTGKDTWYIPGGKREEGESDSEALSREVFEELSVPLQEQTIGKPLGMVVRMTCYTAEFDGELQPSSEISKLDFFNFAQKDQTSAVDHLIMEDLYQKGWIE